MNKRYWLGLLIVFVLVTLGAAYWQNYQVPLDGDLVLIVLPASWYAPVLHDPFGWSAVTKHTLYAGTNRFFAHATLSYYWKHMPLLLHAVASPISSLYMASALFTTVTQALLVFTLAAYVRLSGTGAQGKGAWGFWVAAALVVPLFQTYGFYEQMGVTNRAITYTTFYAFPMALLLLVLWPFYEAAHRQQPLRLHPLRALLIVLLMVVVAFNGPIPVAVVAVVLFGIGLYWLSRQWQATPRRLTLRPAPDSWLSGQAILLLIILGLLCVYSLYLGRFNAENTHDHGLRELYQLLAKGFVQQLTFDWGLPLLLFALLLNSLLMRGLTPATPERQRLLRIMRWVTLFAIIYTLLLPFGGYRPYRPYLIRNDSILPVLLGFIYAYGLSTYYLLFQLRGIRLGSYLTAVVLFGATYLYVDKVASVALTNDCERWALDQMSRSKEPVVRVSDYCTVVAWNSMHNPYDSELQTQMLRYWGITKNTQRYYQ